MICRSENPICAKYCVHFHNFIAYREQIIFQSSGQHVSCVIGGEITLISNYSARGIGVLSLTPSCSTTHVSAHA
jgi:hypothetical protein